MWLPWRKVFKNAFRLRQVVATSCLRQISVPVKFSRAPLSNSLTFSFHLFLRGGFRSEMKATYILNRAVVKKSIRTSWNLWIYRQNRLFLNWTSNSTTNPFWFIFFLLSKQEITRQKSNKKGNLVFFYNRRSRQRIFLQPVKRCALLC